MKIETLRRIRGLSLISSIVFFIFFYAVDIYPFVMLGISSFFLILFIVSAIMIKDKKEDNTTLLETEEIKSNKEEKHGKVK